MQLYFIRHGESVNNAQYARTGSSLYRNEDPELTPTGIQQAHRLANHLADPLFYTPSELIRLKLPTLHSPGAASGLTHLYCSLMVRAAATATIISEVTGVAATAWLDLHENGGIYLDQPVIPEETPALSPAQGAGRIPLESSDAVAATPLVTQRVGLPGKPRSFFQANFPRISLPDGIDEAGWWNRPYEGKHIRPLRAERVLNELIRRHGVLHPDGREDRVALVSHGGFYNTFMRTLLGLEADPLSEDGNDNAALWFGLNNTGVTRIDYLEGKFVIAYQNHTHFLPLELVT